MNTIKHIYFPGPCAANNPCENGGTCVNDQDWLDSSCDCPYSYTGDKCESSQYNILTLRTLNYFCINHGHQSFFQFVIIINFLVSSFRFIWIHMVWVYGHYKYCNSFSAGTDFMRQNLTSTDVRFWRIKTLPALKELKIISSYTGDKTVWIKWVYLRVTVYMLTCQFRKKKIMWSFIAYWS